MPSIVIGNNQDRVKDSYARAPELNLTLRANGEEKVMVMDSLGQFVPAGFDAPTVAPNLAFNAVGSVFPASQWVAYVYVYAATKRYPLVENLSDDRISPRSNSSPFSSIQVAATPKQAIVTVTKAGRVDVSEIWIYRTDFYPTQDEAETAAEAGTIYFLTSVTDDGTAGTISYVDNTLDTTANALIELDNFPAPEFQFCVYEDPYFYGFGNFAFEGNVSVTAAGIVTLTTVTDKWFDGRNGQLVNIEGLTTGGFDGYGTYYFKWLTNTTAQLCLDLQLLQNGPVDATGNSVIHIKGQSCTLYRSKYRNPFGWGKIDIVDDQAIPSIYSFKVGGGNGTAIAVIPILNLLKLDTEGPNVTYVLNLSGAGTPSFEDSKRKVSSDFTVSNHWAQFQTKAADQFSYLWFFDAKYSAICQADGSTNTDVSSNVFDTLRNLSQVTRDRLMIHGIYDARTQLSCLWLNKLGSDTYNDTLVVYHHPTQCWSTLYQRGITCSSSFFDRVTGEQISLVGSELGQIGTLFDQDFLGEWTFGAPFKVAEADPEDVTKCRIVGEDVSGDIGLKVWNHFVGVRTGSNPKLNTPVYLGSARSTAVIYDGSDTVITFDKFRDCLNGVSSNFGNIIPNWHTEHLIWEVWMFSGIIPCRAQKFIDQETPFSKKKLKEVWITAGDVLDFGPGDEFHPPPSWGFSLIGNIIPEIVTSTSTFGIESAGHGFVFKQDKRVPLDSSSTPTTAGFQYYSTLPYPVDQLRSFQLSFIDIGYFPVKLYNYQVAITNASPNNR